MLMRFAAATAVVCGFPLVAAPSQPGAYTDKALACAKQKQWACAIDNYQAAAKLAPDAATCYNLGLAFKYAGRREEACEAFESALRLRPDWADAEYGLGATLYELRREQAALRALRASVAHQPDLLNARLFLAE